jgi:hypothetical protein
VNCGAHERFSSFVKESRCPTTSAGENQNRNTTQQIKTNQRRHPILLNEGREHERDPPGELNEAQGQNMKLLFPKTQKLIYATRPTKHSKITTEPFFTTKMLNSGPILATSLQEDSRYETKSNSCPNLA